MTNTSKDENILLEQAYLRVYESRMAQIEASKPVEEAADEEEDEGAETAAAIKLKQEEERQQMAGKKPTPGVQKIYNKADKKLNQITKDLND